MNQVIPFNYRSAKVRTIQKDDGSVWFVGKDVCSVLGISKHRDAIGRLDDDERGSVKLDTLGGNQALSAISESGLYALVMRSNKPGARPFQKWVTAEVLPSIRKTGSYSMDSAAGPKDLAPITKEMYHSLRLAKYCGLKGNQAVLAANKFVKKRTGYNCMRLLEAPTRLASSIRKAHLTPSDIGKQIGDLSGRKINLMLQKIGLQESFRDARGRLRWKPTDAGKPLSVSKDTGKAHTDGTPVVQLFWLDTVIQMVQKGI